LTTTSSSFRHEDGQALVEYALVLAFVALAAVTALGLLGTNLSAQLSSIAARM
jgi:Flp pilus assembly pilin Flp